MGLLQRRKGHNFEREIARIFRELYPDSSRVLEYQENTANGIDVKAGPFDIQCKRHRTYVPITTIREIHGDEERLQLLITKADREEPMVVLSLNHFLRILHEKDDTVVTG